MAGDRQAAVLISSLLSYHARMSPNAVAVIDGDRRLTYRLLGERVNRLANALSSLGFSKGDHGAVLMRNRHQAIEAYLAYSSLGMVTVPLNFRLGRSELAYQLNDSGARVLILDDEFANGVAACWDELNTPPVVLTIGPASLPGSRHYEDLLAQASTVEPPASGLSLADPNLILYTSGTTGFPKGAVLTQSNQLWSSFNIQHHYRPTTADRSLVTLPLYHTAGLNFSVVPFLHSGGAVVLQRNWDPETGLRLMEAEGCTSAFILPQMWSETARLPLDRFRLGSMNHLVSGGALSPEEDIDRLLAATGGEYSFLMGMTEVGTFLNYLPPTEWRRKNGSVGKPTIHASVRIVDDNGADVGTGETGEMIIQGPSVFSAYWNKPEATIEAKRDGWFHSGDVVVRDEEGFLYIVDRKKDMIRSGGENIYSVEVERMIERHAAVAEAAVIGVPDIYWGENVRAIVALKEGRHADETELVEWCRAHLASYKKPRSVVFVSRLPRNATGKILKHVLREQYGRPDAEVGAPLRLTCTETVPQDGETRRQ